MHYLLDANAMIGLLKDRHSPLARQARRTDPRQIGLSAIVVHELYYGAYKSLRRAENLGGLEAIRFEVLPFDKEDGMAAGEIRATLAAAGTPIGPFDVDCRAGQSARARAGHRQCSGVSARGGTEDRELGHPTRLRPRMTLPAVRPGVDFSCRDRDRKSCP